MDVLKIWDNFYRTKNVWDSSGDMAICLSILGQLWSLLIDLTENLFFYSLSTVWVRFLYWHVNYFYQLFDVFDEFNSTSTIWSIRYCSKWKCLTCFKSVIAMLQVYFTISTKVYLFYFILFYFKRGEGVFGVGRIVAWFYYHFHFCFIVLVCIVTAVMS